MSQRPTPETDSYADRDWWTLFRANEHARELERERDEARAGREAYKQLAIKHAQERDEAFQLLASEKTTRNHIIKRSVEVERERDKAREALMQIEDLFIDGTDIYADREKMGCIAREALKEAQ